MGWGAPERRGYDPGVRLIDSHCHLNADRFDGDEATVLARACATGVERLLVPGWNPTSCRRALEIAEAFDWVDASVGVHPHDAATVEEAEMELVEPDDADMYAPGNRLQHQSQEVLP